ncbi:putative G-protein coupled receptor 33 [Carettochelys insculpta]|uniref:putative G-protein coupled receptor 33 n=1 Tax=Carettochelys insculpta TaxID=44489 RepID=UPI003EC00841
MDQGNTTLSLTPQANSSHSSAAVSAAHLAIGVLLFSTFLVGLVGNGLYLWVLGLKMRRTVTTFLFLHLISCYFLFTLLIPFFAIYVLLGFHWVFGTTMCKLLNACHSVGMFSCVFLLAFISLDRYTFTCHPIWSRHHRTVPCARKLATGIWLVSLALSTPYLVFRETQMEEGRIVCVNNYSHIGDWNGAEMQDQEQWIHLTIFTVWFLLGFLLPSCTIVGCYVRMGLEIKVKGLAQSGKPIKVMVASGISFCVCWLPYHLYYGLTFYRTLPESVRSSLLIIYVVMSSVNNTFTPVLYLFIGGTFQKVLRTSLIALVKAAFDEDFSNDGSGVESSRRHRIDVNSVEMAESLESSRSQRYGCS